MNFADHYWIIGGSINEVYSSKRNARVPLTDAEYVAWRDSHAYDGTPISDEAELASVLRPQKILPEWLFNAPSFIQPSPGTYDDPQLEAYAADANIRKQASGIVVNGQPFATDAMTRSSLNSAHIYTQTNAAATFSWKLPDGSFITLDKAGVDQLHACVTEYAQNCWACEDNTKAAIAADTITTLAEIDAAFDAVSNNFTPVVTLQPRHRQE